MDTTQINVFNSMGFEYSKEILNFLAALFTIFASGIAIYLYFFKRNEIKKVFDFLLSYSAQLSLTELKFKLERLNELNANNETDKEEVINLFNEIVGQIQGNKEWSEQCAVILKKINKSINTPESFVEPKKRSLVFELRESLRNIDIDNYKSILKK